MKSNQITNFVGKSVTSNLKKNDLISNIKTAFDASKINAKMSVKTEVESKSFVAD